MKSGTLVIAAIVLALLLQGGAVTAAPYSITDDGTDISFPNTTLTGDDLYVYGTQAPRFRIDATVSTGWNVTLQCSNFTSAGRTIPSSRLTYTASGGSIIRQKGDAIDPTNGPKETGYTSTLDMPLKCLTCQPNYGDGRYDWYPNPAMCVLLVTADRYAGAYTATLTATIAGGP